VPEVPHRPVSNAQNPPGKRVAVASRAKVWPSRSSAPWPSLGPTDPRRGVRRLSPQASLDVLRRDEVEGPPDAAGAQQALPVQVEEVSAGRRIGDPLAALGRGDHVAVPRVSQGVCQQRALAVAQLGGLPQQPVDYRSRSIDQYEERTGEDCRSRLASEGGIGGSSTAGRSGPRGSHRSRAFVSV